MVNAKIIKILSAIITILLGIVLYFYKKNNPDFSNKVTIILALLILILGALAFFSFYLYNRFLKNWFDDVKKIKLELLDETEARELARKSIENDQYMNHISKWLSQQPYNINGNDIYEFECQLEHEEDKLGKTCFIYINANNPRKLPGILPGNSTNGMRMNKINFMAIEPEKPADVKRIRTINPMTNTEQVVEEKTFQKKKETEEKGDDGITIK